MDEQGGQKDKKMVETKQSKRKKYKPRSPRYPCISLREAVKNAKALFEKEGKTLVAKEVAVKVWGYNKLHGRSLTILAAMAQYGLLRYQSGSVGISDDAFIIIEAPHDSSERKVALERCAKSPTIFDELYQSYSEGLPSDDQLSWTLKQRGFTDEGAQTTIGCLRDTNMFVREELKDYTGGNEEKKGIEEKGKISKPPLIAPKGDFVLSLTLLTGKNATLTISGGTPIREDIVFIKEFLGIYEENLPEENKEEQVEGTNENEQNK